MKVQGKYLRWMKVLSMALLGWFMLPIAQVAQASSASDNAPYMYYINYQYAKSDNSSGRIVIMEYAPDDNGIYQVSVLENQDVKCYVYQVRNNGVYQLAAFEGYSDVEDKRYSQKAQDGQDSLELPSNLAVGTVFYTGYQQNEKNKVLSTDLAYTINQKTYNQTIKIERELSEGTRYYYYAPKVGLIAVEDASGHPLMVLSDVSGKGTK